MSSSTPSPSRSRARWWRGLLLLVVAGHLLALTGAAQQGIAVVARAADDRVRLVVDVPAAGAQRLPPAAFSAAVDGVAQPTTVEPVVSDRLATGLVVDASEAGRPLLQAGISGLADVVLAAPAGARSALVADTAPPELLAPLQPGPTATLRALAAVRPHGERDTAAALDLALRQLPADVTEPRVVVLCTAAADAGTAPAEEIGERLAAAGAVLAVVTTAGDGRAPPYWATAAAATGGIAVSAPPEELVPAVDRVVARLREHYLLTTPAPARLPATVTVRVDAPGGPRTADAVVPLPAAGPGVALPPALRLPVTLAGAVLVLVLAALAVAAGAASRARRSGDAGRSLAS